jgi:hypothetical protein
MKLSFHGAAQDVTGSCFLLHIGRRRILVDCGLYQGGREIDEINAAPFGFDPAGIDTVLLTHAHLDHCGRLPLLHKHGFRGRIVKTDATRELARLALMDAAWLQEEDARRSNGHRRRNLFDRPHRPAVGGPVLRHMGEIEPDRRAEPERRHAQEQHDDDRLRAVSVVENGAENEKPAADNRRERRHHRAPHRRFPHLPAEKQEGDANDGSDDKDVVQRASGPNGTSAERNADFPPRTVAIRRTQYPAPPRRGRAMIRTSSRARSIEPVKIKGCKAPWVLFPICAATSTAG